MIWAVGNQMYEYFPKDQSGNAVQGKVAAAESRNNLFFCRSDLLAAW